jgi:hypothetical protein
MPRLETSNKKQVNEKVQVASRRFRVYAEPTGKRGDVERCALSMGEHSPEPPQGFRSQAWSELWDFSLKVAADQVHAPSHALRILRGEETIRKAATQPQCIQVSICDLSYGEGGKIEITYSASQ